MLPDSLQVLLKLEPVFLHLDVVPLAQLLQDSLSSDWLFSHILVDL